MSSQNSTNTPKKPSLEIVLLNNAKIKVNVSEVVQNQIKYLCDKIHAVEWSGVLFYSVTGSIRDIANLDTLNITLEHIFLMDKGSQAYTEFDWDEDVMIYKMEHPEVENCMIGHIHSHNSMSVFFSGTDMSELNDNCPLHNYYLSVIVNNRLEMMGKIAFTGMPQTYTCLDELGKPYTVEVQLDPKMFVYDCDIQNINVINVSDEFKFRTELIEDKAAKEAESKKKSYQNNYQNNTYNNNGIGQNGTNTKDKPKHNKDNQLYKAPGYYDKSKNGGQKQLPSSFDATKKGWPDDEDAPMIDSVVKEPKDNIIEEVFEDRKKMTIADEFGCYLLRLGNELEEDHIDDVLYDIHMAALDADNYSNMIIYHYATLHEEFFKTIPKKNDIVGTTDELIAYFEVTSISEGYDFLEPIITGLKQFLVNLNIKQEEAEGRI